MVTGLNGTLVTLAGIAALTILTLFGHGVSADMTVPGIAALAGYSGGYTVGKRKAAA